MGRNGADGDRTHNLYIANVALSQLSYGPAGRDMLIRRVARGNCEAASLAGGPDRVRVGCWASLRERQMS